MKKNIAIILFFVFLGMSRAQQSFKGVLLEESSRQPIEFANVGVVGKGFGTVTNDKGEFNLAIPDSLMGEKIRISMIGYKTKEFALGEFKAGTIVYLAADITSLNEVVVQAKKTKIKILGNETNTKHVQGGFKNNSLGAELAIKLNIKHPQTHLRRFFVNINANSLGIPVFRFNLYNADDKGMPKENILKKNIIIEPKQKTGLIELDLTPYEIYVDNDVFIAIEWIKDLGDVKGLSFSTKLIGSTTYYRMASQDKWHSVSPIGMGLYVEAAY